MAALPENTRKRNDTGPPFRFLLQDRNGPVNLTGATSIKLFLKGGQPPVLVTLDATADSGQGTPPAVTGVIDDVSDHPSGRGWANAPIDDTDLGNDGDYNGEVQVIDGAGLKTTFPNKGYVEYRIDPDLDDA